MTVTIERPTSRTRNPHKRAQAAAIVQAEPAPDRDTTPTAATDTTLPAAVRELLDQAKAWPEYESYFRDQARAILGRPIPQGF